MMNVQPSLSQLSSSCADLSSTFAIHPKQQRGMNSFHVTDIFEISAVSHSSFPSFHSCYQHNSVNENACNPPSLRLVYPSCAQFPSFLLKTPFADALCRTGIITTFPLTIMPDCHPDRPRYPPSRQSSGSGWDGARSHRTSSAHPC